MLRTKRELQKEIKVTTPGSRITQTLSVSASQSGSQVNVGVHGGNGAQRHAVANKVAGMLHASGIAVTAIGSRSSSSGAQNSVSNGGTLGTNDESGSNRGDTETGEINPAFQEAVISTFSTVKSARRFNLERLNDYSGLDIGIYIYKDENGYSYETRTQPSPNMADGEDPRGAFGPNATKPPDNIAALVIAAKSYTGHHYIMRRYNDYVGVARRIDAPVFVIPFKHYSGDSVYKFDTNGDCAMWTDGGACN